MFAQFYCISSREEEEELLAEWKPEPLVPEIDPDHPALHVPVIDDKVDNGCFFFVAIPLFYQMVFYYPLPQPGKHITVEGHRCFNMATHNYLGFAGNEEVERSAVSCIRKFGVGSCGPRAFYGTAGTRRQVVHC